MSSTRVGTKNTSALKRGERSVRCHSLLDSFLWISDMLNDVFVSDVCGLINLPFHSQWSRFFQYVYASVCCSHAFDRCCMFLKFLLITFPILIFKNSTSIVQKTVFFK